MRKKDRSKTTNRAFSMQQLRDLSDRIEAYGGEEAAVRWWVTTPLVAMKYPDKVAAVNYARGAIRSLLRPNEPHNQVARDQLALLMRELGKPQIEESVRVVAETVEVEAAPVSQVVPALDGRTRVVEVEPPTAETGIVVREGDWRFRIEAKTAQAAKDAVVSLTDLAERLQYSDKSKLKALANDPLHRENLNKFGTVRGASVVSGFGRVTQEPLFNRGQTMYLISKSGTAIANDLTAEYILAMEALRERFEGLMVAAPLVDPTSTILAFMREQQAATERANERRDALLLEGLKGILGAAKPASQNDPEPPTAAVAKPAPSPLPAPKQTRIRFPVNRRSGLIKLVKAQVPALSTGAVYSSAIRKAWHELYAEMDKYGVHVLRCVADLELRTNEEIDYIDWIEENGHLDLAIECAFRIFTKAA